MTRVTIIAAVARNGIVGADGGMPWHLPDELKLFKTTTLGHALVMGRVTFDAIGRVLPGRRTIVMTRDPQWTHPDVEVAHSFAEALDLAGPATQVFVAGGAQVWAHALPFAHRVLYTQVDAEPEGDTAFPSWDRSGWVSGEQVDGAGWTRVTWDRP